MGGNALKNVTTRRYQAAEYSQLERDVCVMLRKHFPASVSLMPILYYRNKESFGDLDILVSSDNLPNDWQDGVAALLQSKEVVRNGNVVSFEHKEFQIDLIATPTEDFVVADKYFAYNDLGNLLGRLANSMGLKLGHQGLFYNWQEGTEKYHTAVLTKDWGLILRVLGLDLAHYRAGFDTLEDIFEFVASSRFFNPAIYLLANRNNRDRVRDEKRKTYMEFLGWCARLEQPYPTRYPDKESYLPYLFEMIPGFQELDTQVRAKWERSKRLKAVFNGNIVGEATGLSGKELGAFMQWFKETTEGFVDRMLAMNPEVVPGWIAYRYEGYKQQKGLK